MKKKGLEQYRIEGGVKHEKEGDRIERIKWNGREWKTRVEEGKGKERREWNGVKWNGNEQNRIG